MAELEVLFMHEPLDLASSKTIRLIEVLPPGENESVRCKLIHSTTDHAYVGLSYVWGTDEPVHVIYINHRPYRVRRNLWDFLKIASQKLRYEPSSLRSQGDGLRNARWTRQYIWIDALCIDQKDTLERNHQVQQMGNIYGNAQRVLVWFGTESRAVMLIEKLHTLDVGKDLRSLPDCKVLMRRFCEDVYWTRAWTTQEVLLAKDITFLANEAEAEMSELEVSTGESLGHSGRGNGNHCFQPLFDILKRQDRYTLFENICYFRHKRCLDKRDVVYSLLSISQLTEGLRVDYNVNTLELTQSVLNDSKVELCLCYSKAMYDMLQVSEESKMRGDSSFVEVDLQASFLTEQTEDHWCCSENLELKAIVKELACPYIWVYCLGCSWRRPLRREWERALHHGHLVLPGYGPEHGLPRCTFWLPPKWRCIDYSPYQLEQLSGTQVLDINGDGSIRLKLSSEDFATLASMPPHPKVRSTENVDYRGFHVVAKSDRKNPRWTIWPRDGKRAAMNSQKESEPTGV